MAQSSFYGCLHAKRGQTDDARSITAKIQEIQDSRRKYVSSVARAAVHIGLGEHDEAFKLLDEAIGRRGEWLVCFKVDPVFSDLRRDPLRKSLLEGVLEEIGFPRWPAGSQETWKSCRVPAAVVDGMKGVFR